MPAPVLVVHNERDTRALALGALHAAGLGAIGFNDPTAALAAIELDSCVRVLVTRINFGKGKLDGLALARRLLVRQCGVKTVFIDRPEYERLAEGAGDFLHLPLNHHHLVDVVARLLKHGARPPSRLLSIERRPIVRARSFSNVVPSGVAGQSATADDMMGGAARGLSR